jgi:ABC-type glycerol-3-phosphate transport system substrate-binding protein
MRAFQQENGSFFKITYVEKNPQNFNQEIISAVAAGTGPDMFFGAVSDIYELRNIVMPLPFSSYNERTYLDTFVDEGQLFLGKDGISAFPLAVDPLVMYWNKDIFAEAGVPSAPQYWEQFQTLAEKLTRKDEKGNISVSAVGLGGVSNVSHLKAILSTLFMQIGDPITAMAGNNLVSVLGHNGDGLASAVSALRFYVDFADPVKTAYTWNSALPNSRDAFEAGRLGVYFGFASEYSGIKKRNPHLNFDVAVVPQRQVTKVRKSVFANMFGVAVLKSSKNMGTAFRALGSLSGSMWGPNVAQFLGLPPARRSALSVTPPNPAQEIFFKSAILGNSWLDPSVRETDAIFADMVRSVESSESELANAINKASLQIGALSEQPE